MIRCGAMLFMIATGAAGCISTTESHQAGHVFRDCSDCPEMVVVVSGMDGPAGFPDALAVGRYEVTRDEFARFEKEDQGPSPRCSFAFAGKSDVSIDEFDAMNRDHPGLGGYQPSGSDPAICISWNEALAFVEWLSKKTGHKYRLPSARELQFFESANATTHYAWGDRAADACAYANGLDRTAVSQDWAINPRPDLEEYLPTKQGVLDCDDGFAYTAPVGSFEPNALGLYDTIGNVWEWSADCVADRNQWPEGAYYPPCLLRGGGWKSGPLDLTNGAQRQELSAENPPDVGFRVVRLIGE